MNQREAAKHPDQRCMTADRKALLEAIPRWTWDTDKDTTRQYSDTCPKCKRNINFHTANTQDLDNVHDDGKGGKCRFRGAVIDGKIQANVAKTETKKCFKCGALKARMEYHADQWNKTGKNANRRTCKTCH